MEQVQMQTKAIPASSAGRRSPWQRKENPKTIVLQERDRRVLEFLWESRFAEIAHIGCYLGVSKESSYDFSHSALARRLRLLYDAGYIHRPLVARPTRVDMGALVYSITKKGAEFLGESWEVRLETSWPHAEHQLLVTTVTTCLRMGFARIKEQLPERKRDEHSLSWVPYPNRKEAILRIVTLDAEGKKQEETVFPDGFFQFTTTQKKLFLFLEADRNSKTPDRLGLRYRRYRQWFENQRAKGNNFDMKVLTVIDAEPGKHRLKALRKAAHDAWQNPKTKLPWAGFLFLLRQDLSLAEPERIYSKILLMPQGEERVPLLEI